MMTIWKFELKPDRGEVVEMLMPRWSRILSVGGQHGTIMVWALVDSDTELVPFIFHVFGTGHKVSSDSLNKPFLGTVFLDPLVFHVFGGLAK